MVLTDKYTNQQVLGCLMKNPLLLIDHEVQAEDFGQNKIARLIFISIVNLFNAGAKTLVPMEVDQDICRYEGASTFYEREKGIEILKDSFKIAEVENFDYHYNRLKKLSLLRTLNKNGYNISSFYKEEFDTLKEEKETIQRFDDASVETILNEVEGKYNKIRQEFLRGRKEDTQASAGIDKLVDELLASPEIGVPLPGDLFNTAFMGARLGKFYLRSASSGAGKAIVNTEKVPLPDGTWTTVGEVKPGDYLIGRDGTPTKVLAVHPQPEKKRAYKIYFKSGKTIECCEEHLWSYYRKTGKELITSSVKEILESNIPIQEKDGGYNFKVPINEPVQYSKKEYKVEPYVMGLILGDGSFRYNPNNKQFSFSSEDEELPKIIAEHLNCFYRKNSEKNYNWTFSLKENRGLHKILWVEELLEDYPCLWNVKSEDKFIPEEYLFGSVEQRYSLLRGLLDTDGSIDKRGRIGFSSVSQKMIKQVEQLCYSLGFTCHIGEDKREIKYTTGIAYELHIQCPKKIKPLLFGLERKKRRAEDYANNQKRYEDKKADAIIKIERTERFEEMTCFTVDAPDSLFLVGDYIVTHNTRLAVFDACHICFPERWDFETSTFVKEVDEEGKMRPPRKTLIITTELSKDEIQTMMLAFLSGVNEEHILLGKYMWGELERVRYAIRIMKRYKNYFFIDEIPDPNLSNVKMTIKKYATVEKVKYVAYDYIFSSPSLIESLSNVREDVALTMLSTQLKDLAKEYNIFITSSTQVNGEAMNGEGFKNETCLRGSKGIADKIDCGSMVVRVGEKEGNDLNMSLREAGKAPPKRMPNFRFDIYKNRRGRYKSVSVWAYIDLGTGEREDLYITTASGKIIKEFTVLENETYRKVADEEWLKDGLETTTTISTTS